MAAKKKHAQFEVYDADNQRLDSWRWRLRAPNGEIVASGEGYTSRANALRGIAAVKRNVVKAAKYKTIEGSL